MEYRIEKDTMGEVKVPAHVYWGAQTQRSIENFKIAQDINKMPKEIIKAFAYLKKAAALTNFDAGILPKEKCDLIICLSHLGYTYKNEPDKISDLKLAAITHDIDLIIGGHTHTFLDKPTIVENAIGKKILVNQVGCYGINLGRIDFYFDSEKNVSTSGTSIIV